MPLRTLGRTLRRLGLALRRPRVDIVASPDYVVHLPGRLHDPFRAGRILATLREEGLLELRHLHTPPATSLWRLRLVHTDDYLEALERPGALLRAVGARLPDRAEQRLLEAQRTMVGGTLLAARLALGSGRLAFNLGGGLHHAQRDRAAGFCLYNDVAVAIATLRHERNVAPILVLDLDLHDGDGTRAIFAEDPSVHTFSIHNRAWDDRHGIESTSIALGTGVGDEELLETLKLELPPLLDLFRPRLVFYLAGSDVAFDDELGDWRMTADGILRRDLFVARQLARRRIPGVVLLAGGYGDSAWRYSARFAATVLLGRRLDPPSTSAMVMNHFRGIAEQLSPEALGAPSGEEPLLTADDLAGALGLSAAESRFLGFYTPAGVELALERLGYLERLRALGFDRPTLDLDLGNPAWHTLRIYGARDRKELLVELRVRRDRSTIAGFELLRVEWLLLQNPRARFNRVRPALPGQQHPGLGMLRETIAALVLVCDRLKLEGIVVVTSRYHTATVAMRDMRALDPDVAGRLRALREALADLSVAEASRRVEGGGVVDEATGEPLPWRPVAMVLPVSKRLRERLATGDYAEAAERSYRAARYRLAEGSSAGASSTR